MTVAGVLAFLKSEVDELIGEFEDHQDRIDELQKESGGEGADLTELVDQAEAHRARLDKLSAKLESPEAASYAAAQAAGAEPGTPGPRGSELVGNEGRGPNGE